MKSTLTKYPAMIAMFISVISFILMIAALVALITDPPAGTMYSRSFVFWMWGVIVALFSLIFYFVDAVFSAIKALMKIHPVFNTVLSIMLLLAIPMCIFLGGGVGIGVYIWNVYYLAIFVLEVISISKHMKLNSKKTEKLAD